MRLPPAPRLRLALAWLLALLLAYTTFEFGRSIAGYSAASAFAQRWKLAQRVASLEREADGMRRELAERDIGRRVDQQAQTEAQAMIGELQAELARQQQDLDFYRGLVSERFGSGNLKVQELAVQRGEAGQFVVEVTLVQTSLRDQLASGTLSVSVDGARRGALTRLGMREISAEERSQVSFNLRYFQTLRIPIVLPGDFEPAALRLEYRSNRSGPDPQQLSFPWASVLEPAPANALTPGPAAG